MKTLNRLLVGTRMFLVATLKRLRRLAIFIGFGDQSTTGKHLQQQQLDLPDSLVNA